MAPPGRGAGDASRLNPNMGGSFGHLETVTSHHNRPPIHPAWEWTIEQLVQKRFVIRILNLRTGSYLFSLDG
ncbi:hypothetical protein [Microseira sp. BLCC-F43]|jgi:hypothetical protein|uniref:hypothetical protein n=1 Tax=Microseira sp. BLCC-F43 TaxID=3153602 RepID=UPI0035B74704